MMGEKKQLSHAIFQRFLPATAAVYLAVLAVSAVADPGGLSWMPLAVAAVSTALITSGFATVAALFRASLGTSIHRRSLIAGFVAPLAVGAVSIFAQGASDATIAVLTFTAGAVTGVVALGTGMLKRREQEPLDPDVLAELERLEAELAIATPGDYALLETQARVPEPRVSEKVVTALRGGGKRSKPQE
jgi:hypothetical protein